MKYLLILLVCCSCGGTKGTQDTTVTNTDSSITAGTTGTSKPDTVTKTVEAGTQEVIAGKPIALYFGSMASGPIGDEFLKTWLQQFISEEKVNITADKFSACGKEGEYIIVINKTAFSAATEDKFSTGLKTLIDNEVKRAKSVSASSGSVEIRENPKVEDYTYCRLGSKKWL